MAKYHAGLWDYILFCVFTTFCLIGALWTRIFHHRRQKTKSEFVFARGEVAMISVMISLARGTLAPRTILGFPAEMYYYGSGMWETLYGLLNAYPIVCYVFVPVYFNLRITSIYQYLEMRFHSKAVRSIASLQFIARSVMTLGIAVYAPCVALESVTDIPRWLSISVMTIFNISLAILGGLTGAIHADVISTIYIISMLVTVIIRSTYMAGGVDSVYSAVADSGRLKFFYFTGDMTDRVDTLSGWLGYLFITVSQMGCQQNFMARYFSLKSVEQVQKAMISNIPLAIVFFSLNWLVGMGIYATYKDCDIMEAGHITKMDQILPFFIQRHFGFIPGCVGIFLAVLFNSVFCINVSNVNALATVLFEDFLRYIPGLNNLSDVQQLKTIKILVVFNGLVIMLIAFAIGLLPGVIESSMLAFSATAGALLGIFILAMLVPIANAKGTVVGSILGTVLVVWMAVGRLSIHVKDPMLPTTTKGCKDMGIEIKNMAESRNDVFMGFANNYTRSIVPEEGTILYTFYSITYMYYGLFGCLCTVIISILVTICTLKEEDEKYDGVLLHPVILSWSEKCAWNRFTKPYVLNKTTYSMKLFLINLQLLSAVKKFHTSRMISKWEEKCHKQKVTGNPQTTSITKTKQLGVRFIQLQAFLLHIS